MNLLASRGQLRASLLRWVLLLVPAVLLAGFLSGELARSGPGNPWFDALVKPPLFPPPAVFGIVWTILYALMGFACAIVCSAWGARGRGLAIAVFVVQLALNLAWSPLFFAAHQVTSALYLIIFILMAAIATVFAFAPIRKAAAWLLVPYIAWLCFAAILNFQIDQRNPDAESKGVVVPAATTQIG